MEWKKALAIINPRAGRYRSEKSVPPFLRKRFAEQNGNVVIREVSGPLDARTWTTSAAQEGFDLVIVCGGDGTLHEAANGLLHATSLPIAILPSGSGNVLAQELGIPKKLATAVELIWNGTRRWIDVGYLESHDRFVIGALTLGHGSRIITDTRQTLKKLLGFPAYFLSAAEQMTRIHPAAFRCVFDGAQQSIVAKVIMVTNVRLESLHLSRIAPKISVDDGKFDVIVVSSNTIQDVARTLRRFLLPPGKAGSPIVSFPARSIELSAGTALPLVVDGEALETKRIHMTVRQKSLEVIAPK